MVKSLTQWAHRRTIMLHDPVFNKMFDTIRNIDDGAYELQPLDSYYQLIENTLHGKSEMDKIKYIAGLLQQIDYLKSQQGK